jgi:hypothetical protein
LLLSKYSDASVANLSIIKNFFERSEPQKGLLGAAPASNSGEAAASEPTGLIVSSAIANCTSSLKL